MSKKIVNPAFAKSAEEQRKKQEEVELSEGGNYTTEYTEIKYFGLENKKGKAFRILGNTVEIRENEFDPKLILQSEIVKDTKKGYCRINWPITIIKGKDKPNPEWILTKLYNKVMDCDWENLPPGQTTDDGKTYRRIFHNTGTEVFARINGNMKIDERGFPKNFYPRQRVLLNIIDHHDTWCADNKHSKILSSGIGSKDYTQEDDSIKRIYFPQIGIPFTVYSKIFEHFMRFRGDWDVDAVVEKQSEEKSYDIYDATDEKYLSEEVKKYANVEPLSSEELAYERYDLDVLYNISSYTKLLSNLTGLFKLCDTELGTTFFEELQDLVRVEKAEWAAKKTAKDVEEKSNTSESNNNTSENNNTEIESEPVKKRRKKKDNEESPSITEAIASYYPYWDNLDEEEQSVMITSIQEITSNEVIFHKSVSLEGCYEEDCTCEFPDGVETCPMCGSTGE